VRRPRSPLSSLRRARAPARARPPAFDGGSPRRTPASVRRLPIRAVRRRAPRTGDPARPPRRVGRDAGPTNTHDPGLVPTERVEHTPGVVHVGRHRVRPFGGGRRLPSLLVPDDVILLRELVGEIAEVVEAEPWPPCSRRTGGPFPAREPPMSGPSSCVANSVHVTGADPVMPPRTFAGNPSAQFNEALCNDIRVRQTRLRAFTHQRIN
jgi:hypothetical protein